MTGSSPDSRKALTRATLADVAMLAGVSPKTVSRVLNGDGPVSAATRQRVESAIVSTGFRLNHAARALAGARSFLIGLFTMNRPSFYFSELYRAAAREGKSRGYHLVLEEFDNRDDTFLPLYMNGLRMIGCDGIILPGPISDDLALLDALDRDGVRYVRLAPALDIGRSTAIFPDDRRGAAAIARHLWDSGRRRFTVIAGPANHASAAVRRDAFVETIVAAGGAATDIRILALDQRHDVDQIPSAVQSALDGVRPGEAVFAFNDEIALQLMLVARQRGLNLPGDLAIAGFDDSDMAPLAWPSLTTVRQPISDLAHHAVAALVGDGRGRTESICCPVQLVVRDSTRSG